MHRASKVSSLAMACSPSNTLPPACSPTCKRRTKCTGRRAYRARIDCHLLPCPQWLPCPPMAAVPPNGCRASQSPPPSPMQMTPPYLPCPRSRHAHRADTGHTSRTGCIMPRISAHTGVSGQRNVVCAVLVQRCPAAQNMLVPLGAMP